MSNNIAKSSSIWRGNRSLAELPPSLKMIWYPEDEPGAQYYHNGTDWILKESGGDSLIWRGNRALGELPTSNSMIWYPIDEPGAEYYHNGADWVLKESGGSTVFAADIVVSLSAGRTFGKYTTGQTIPSAGKTAEEVLRMAAIEELLPTLTNPDNTFALTQAGLREIGEVIATLNFSAGFNRGTISPAYTTSGLRSGLPSFYKYVGTGLPASVASSALVNAQTVSNYTVLTGVQTWSNIVTSLIGEQPKTSAGNDYLAPYPAGDTASKAVTITGVYPWFGTSAAIATLTKQPLSLMNATYVGITVAGEDGVNKQKVQFPIGWSAITGIQFYNTNNSTWEWVNGSKAASLLTFTQSATTQTIQGNVVNYTAFTHNGSTTGGRQLRFYTN